MLLSCTGDQELQHHSPLLPCSSAGQTEKGKNSLQLPQPFPHSLLSNKQSCRVLKASYLGDHPVQSLICFHDATRGKAAAHSISAREASESSTALSAGPGQPPSTGPGIVVAMSPK